MEPALIGVFRSNPQGTKGLRAAFVNQVPILGEPADARVSAALEH